jgi:iron complex outermembrane receptor protein
MRRAKTSPSGLYCSALVMLALPALTVSMTCRAAEEGRLAVADTLEEVVVTGTRVRGEAPVGSTVTIVKREDLAAAGIASTEQILQMVPSLSNLGLSESSRGSQLGSQNLYGGASFNLHGLGATATLSLIDGNRMVVSGAGGLTPDPSIVPTTMLERAEVLADGASAVYGSDAVGGVVNLILRRRVEGVEVNGRYGSAADYHDYRVGVVAGHVWDLGQLTVGIESNYHTPLAGTDRDYNRMNLASLGGTDQSVTNCAPGNLTLNGVTYPIPVGTVNSTTWVAGPARTCEPYQFNDILPSHRHTSAAATFDWQFNDRVSLTADAVALQRKSRYRFAYQTSTVTVRSNNPYFTLPAGVALTALPACAAPNQTLRCETISYYFSGVTGSDTRDYVGNVKTYNFHTNLTVGLPGDWRLQPGFTTGVDRSRGDGYNINGTAFTAAVNGTTLATAVDPYSTRTLASVLAPLIDFVSGSDTTSVSTVYDLAADGRVLPLPAGEARAALGIERRQEDWTGRNLLGSPSSARLVKTFNRHIDSVYGELVVPVLGRDAGGRQKLELSIADRYERYSDFGSTSNPKYAVTYSPSAGYALRANYSTSFHAPGPNYLVGSVADTSLFLNAIDPANGNIARPTLQINAANPLLKPERSRNWSVGFDLDPAAWHGFTAAVTYFDIDFKDLIQAQFNNPDILRQEAQYAALITRNPTAQQLADVLARYPLVGATAAGTVVAIIDGRPNNTGEIKTTGVDFDLKLALQPNALGKLAFGLSGTYLSKYEQAATPTAPLVEQVNTYGYPVKLRARGMISLTTSSGWVANAFINRTGSYTDPAQPPTAAYYHIDAWTTLDLGVSYSFRSEGHRPTSALNLGLNITNAFDKDPPFVNRGAFLFNPGGWDPQQASALGRLIAVTLSKKL